MVGKPIGDVSSYCNIAKLSVLKHFFKVSFASQGSVPALQTRSGRGALLSPLPRPEPPQPRPTHRGLPLPPTAGGAGAGPGRSRWAAGGCGAPHGNPPAAPGSAAPRTAGIQSGFWCRGPAAARKGRRERTPHRARQPGRAGQGRAGAQRGTSAAARQRSAGFGPCRRRAVAAPPGGRGGCSAASAMSGPRLCRPQPSRPARGIVVQSPIGNTDYLITPRRGA